ncbi:MAG TPA: peroxiredoxin [Steroidobacteraceae bacterium]|jgi:peroxiredoxin Q/BCP|nr:peroxiredoxin [Steroidobacteraceae bacterium]
MKRFLRGAAAALAITLATAVAAGEAPAVGSAAPGFRLQDQKGEWHDLADYKGKWVVLYFYPKDNTPGCTTQACEFRDNIFAYRDMGAVILGVSVDDVASHKAFSGQHSLPFPILADSGKTTAAAYGTLTTYKDMVLSQRDTFIIDPEGRIAKHYVKVDPKGHSEAVLADLKQLMAGAAKKS